MNYNSGGESSYFGPKSIQRVTIESVNGEPFDPEATYAVVTNNFCTVGGDTYNVFSRRSAGRRCCGCYERGPLPALENEQRSKR